ncbi:MAG: SUMF1/EgtB/PvdO family nonheme iron enzyme [Proteobacteria bacterium]|nr:SUMF1/EgtB/PvdO family nonheme iron enzyme [Pseudomonadota bacterium]
MLSGLRMRWIIASMRVAHTICLLIACLIPSTVFAQDVDSLRRGVVKLSATANGVQKTGTGFIVHHDKQVTFIVTAMHIVEGDKFPKVAFYGQPHAWIDAEVLKNDPRTDISLLKVRDNAQIPMNIAPLNFSPGEDLKDSDELSVIGFPGAVDWARIAVALAGKDGLDLIIDRQLQEGFSGAPLIKHNKAVIGLITRTDDFGRAIPSDIVKKVITGWGIATSSQPSGRNERSTTPTTAKPAGKTLLPFEPEMVRIAPGKFLMGSPRTDKDQWFDEAPQHEVSIGYAFEIGKYEITFDEYDTFARATNRELPLDFFDWGRGRRPVINVSFDDALAYVKWLSEQTGKYYRLPSEAEWEYAARAGSQTRYWWGDAIGKNNAVCDGCGSKWDHKQTAPVGSFQANAFGLHDTSGNVYEWVQDCWYDNYINAPIDGSAWREKDGGACNSQVARGGAWGSLPRGIRSADRIRGIWRPIEKNFLIGFRIVRDF